MTATYSNIWTHNTELLAPAFNAVNNEQTINLVMLGLRAHLLERSSCRIVDIGGGRGHLASKLASIGHSVTVVDIDPSMLQEAENHFKSLSPEVNKRLKLIAGTVDNVLNNEPYDVVCCHSVLMYEHDWSAFVHKLARLLRPGGLISVMCVNPQARAMRLGRQRKWREVIATISTGQQCDPSYVLSNDILLEELETEFRALEIKPSAWYGVGVFEDGSCDESLAAEWLAGTTEPYRSIARSYHLIGVSNFGITS